VVKLLFISIFHFKNFGLVPFLELKTPGFINFILFVALFSCPAALSGRWHT